MVMATKQENRLEERFRLWDSNGNGTIERADFEREADDIIARLGAQGTRRRTSSGTPTSACSTSSRRRRGRTR